MHTNFPDGIPGVDYIKPGPSQNGIPPNIPRGDIGTPGSPDGFVPWAFGQPPQIGGSGNGQSGGLLGELTSLLSTLLGDVLDGGGAAAPMQSLLGSGANPLLSAIQQGGAGAQDGAAQNQLIGSVLDSAE